jgi:hypothetical protein
MKSLTTVQDNTKALAGIVKNVTSNSYHFSRICLIGNLEQSSLKGCVGENNEGKFHWPWASREVFHPRSRNQAKNG